MSSTGAQERPPPEVLTLTEMAAKYKDRWVAIEVTERDENLQPVKGRVLADDIDRYNLREKTAKYNEVCIFYTGDVPYRLLL